MIFKLEIKKSDCIDQRIRKWIVVKKKRRGKENVEQEVLLMYVIITLTH